MHIFTFMKLLSVVMETYNNYFQFKLIVVGFYQYQVVLLQ